MSKIRIYVIARISEDAHLWTDKICNELDDSFEIFKPKDHNPWAKRHESLSKNVYDVDVEAIDGSHLGLMLPEYGNDCAWEAGYYAGSNKPAVIFVHTQMDWLRDWMVKGGVKYVVTNSLSTYEVLRNDPILKHKEVILIKSIGELNDTLHGIYDKHYAMDLSEAL